MHNWQMKERLTAFLHTEERPGKGFLTQVDQQEEVLAFLLMHIPV